MFAWVESCLRFAPVAMVGLSLLLAATSHAQGKRFGLGTRASVEQIAGWDIDIRPDGQGLPAGQGSAEEGEPIYVEKCASCHGEFGEARGRYPMLMGGEGTLDSEDPVKTVGSYWPYASTVFDYVRRAMPFGHAQSLSNDETYAITAFLLNLNELVEYDEVLDAGNLAKVKMPNADGFIADDRPDTPTGEPCMSNCSGERSVVGKARVIDVTPDGEAESAEPDVAESLVSAGDAARGKKVFTQCAACHSLSGGEHRVGPSLQGIVGRRAGSVSGFPRYSGAMKAAGISWTEDNLRKYLASPQAFISGTTMPFAGITDEGAVKDLVAYLKEAAK